MSISAGTRLGAYEIVSVLGAGGMGEVYRARDTRLGREVALKIILEAFATSADRIARFQREAKVLASLNHPHIAALYGIEESDGQHFLVMELVEGQTLADRLARGPLPAAETIAIAVQIADALEAAHERGVVHRDLKPANVKVTPDDKVKVLDFGLAKAVETEATSANAANSPTLSMMASQAGIILGTAAYMSPEQAKGLAADHRSDIFSFGSVLFEMLTGRQPFHGETAPEVLASVLIREPDIDRLPSDLNPRIVDLIRRCLEKQPKRRWQAIGDVRAELEAIAAAPRSGPLPMAPVPPRPRWRRALPTLLAVILVGATAAVAAWMLKPAAPPKVVRFAISLAGTKLLSAVGRHTIAVSPDGSLIAYVADQRVYLRPIDDLRAVPLQGAEDLDSMTSPAFSPDGRSLAFFSTADNAIKRIAVTGGAPVTVCRIVNLAGMSWGPHGIVFAEMTSEGRVIKLVPAGGGVPRVLVKLERNELLEGPELMPDGDTILISAATDQRVGADRWDKAQVLAISVKSGQRKVVVEGGADAHYLATGHVVYAVGGVVYAVPFDLGSLKVTGEPFQVIDGVRRAPAGVTGIADFNVSRSGTLAYVSGPAGASGGVAFAFADVRGSLTPLPLSPGAYTAPRVNRDGTRIAMQSNDGRSTFIAIYDRNGSTGLRRITFDANSESPVWSPDGKLVAFQSTHDGETGMFAQAVDGSGAPERLTRAQSGEAHVPQSWFGDVLLYDVVTRAGVALWQLSLKDGKTAPFDGVRSINDTGALFSPDGKWVAYALSEAAQPSSLFVQPFPATGARYMLVTGRVTSPHHPIWAPDTSAIFYVPGPGVLERVPVTTQPSFSFGNPETVPRPFQGAPPASHRPYDMAPDGRILGIVTPSQAAGAPAPDEIRVVVNWFEELRARARQ